MKTLTRRMSDVVHSPEAQVDAERPSLAKTISRNSQGEKLWPSRTRYFIFFAGFLISCTFGVTQVPILYVFRLMSCDAYYDSHPADSDHPKRFLEICSAFVPPVTDWFRRLTASSRDRCSHPQIEANTALQVSILGGSTTAFGLLNLFITTSLIKKIGIKPAIVLNVFFPAVRLLIQNFGVATGGALGIVIFQSSQVASIIGGPSGYVLSLNTYISEVVEYDGRTAALGRVQGCMMFGSALGFLAGGLIGDAFGIIVPFRVTFAMFLLSTIYVTTSLPHIPPADPSGADVDVDISKPSSRKGLAKFVGPMTVFLPQTFVSPSGQTSTEYGTFLLGWGVFLGILATGYIPTFLQMYSTDRFDFKTRENGWLIFMYSSLRGCFLTLAFPKIIQLGRQYMTRREKRKQELQEAETARGMEAEQAPLLPATSGHGKDGKTDETFAFDLIYTKFSLIVDGSLTLLCTFVRQGWQMFLVAAILPFGAGTGSAAKGTILQMLGSRASRADRTDALAGVSLLENISRLSTTAVFGAIFAAFARIGRTELVFICNAGVALVGFLVVVSARFPPDGWKKLKPGDDEEVVEGDES